jgi:hypothetical protein
MRGLAVLVGALLLGLLLAAPAGAATAVAERTQLRGHLPELGERATMRVFQTQTAYDAFRTSLGEANVFPVATSLFMTFDKDILALYARGNDSGGRCLRAGPNATLDGDTTTLDLQWESGSCGAPLSAHYPFVLVSLSRTAADGSSWITPARSVCAAAPGVSDSRACASLGTSTVSPSPAGGPASPSPAPTATVGASPSPTLTAAATTAAPSPTPSAVPSPTRSAVAVASPTLTVSPSAQPVPGGSNNDFLITAALVGLGVLIGIAIMAARRPRRSIRRIP